MHFDIFTIRQWQQGYTLRVGIARPRNAPRGKFTKADQRRVLAANKKNQDLIGRMFTLQEVMEVIKRLQIPEETEETKEGENT
jgi:hypothetical protein